MGAPLVGLWRGVRALPSWALPLALAVVVLLLPFAGLGFSATRQIQLALILALLVSGLNLSLGYAGELALGQPAMYAAGAYTAGIMSVAGTTDVLVQLVAGGVVALVVGLVTGVPGLRLGSWSLAMTSFFLVLVLPDVIAILEPITGGRNGLSGIPGPTLLGQVLDDTGLYILLVVVAALWFAFMRNIVVSRHGVAFRVLKQSPVLASSVGISVFRMKLVGYALGAIPAGLAGVLFANLDLYIAPEAFGFTIATTVLAASILGGTASVYGALVGAAVMQFGPNQSSAFQEYALVFYGVFLVVGGVLLSGGLSGLARRAAARLDRSADIRPAPVPRGDGPSPDGELSGLAGASLEVVGLEKSFGGNRALHGVDFAATPGRVTALIGPNGSGKTTMLNMICGFYSTDAGTITLDGEAVQHLPSYRVARAGVARTFQTPNIPGGLTVEQAVAAGRYSTEHVSMVGSVVHSRRFRHVRRADATEVARALAVVGMEHLADAEAAALPLGMRRQLEVARALVARPRVLLLDEAASGLDEAEVARLALAIRRIRDAGGTVVLVEHNFRLVLELADQIVVLAQGAVIGAGPPEVIEHEPRVLAEYLGVTPEDVAGSALGAAAVVVEEPVNSDNRTGGTS
ncbi:branched-chain amino acid ABC transporter ATP-binding protein/permease [Pseudonocardia xishanensis]|uniref:ABC transporter domain-containing protein n=1 Tax=Pseudonocardia xishanensis TaxID=630995 RepID=A0ABP8RQG3_9PSEU